MFKKNMKKFAAAAIAASMLMSAGVAAYAYSDQVQAAAAEEPKATLNLASDAESTEDETATAAEASEDTTEADETADQTEADDNGASLNLSDSAAQKADQAEETETETEEAKNVNTEKLEGTSVDEASITATDVSELVKNVMPSIVAVSIEQVSTVRDYFTGQEEEYTESGAGSGVIISQTDDELLIATNNHVAEDATNLTVCFSVEADSAEDLLAPATVKGTDPDTDLAVLAVNLSDINSDVFKQLKIATLGSSDDVEVGDAAIVIGNALGEGMTVATGIVSAENREINTSEGDFTEMQLDVSANLGCSGGAVLNSKGEVIGIFNAKAVSNYAEGMGYAIPIDTAIPVLQDLINRQTRTVVENHGYLGVTVVPVSEDAMNMYNMPAGAYVYEVGEGSAAEDAGIKKGDIITKFDGISVDSNEDLVNLIKKYNVGETVTVEAQVPDGSEYKTEEFEVTLQEGASQTTDSDDSDSNSDSGQNDELPQYQDNNNNSNGMNGFQQFFFGN